MPIIYIYCQLCYNKDRNIRAIALTQMRIMRIIRRQTIETERNRTTAESRRLVPDTASRFA